MTTTKQKLTFDRNDLLRALRNHIGKKNGVRCDVLAQEVSGSAIGTRASQRRVRSLVNALRNEGQHICATPSDGYYIAQTEAELNETCEFLHERAMSTLVQISKMKNIAIPDLRGQLRLNT